MTEALWLLTKRGLYYRPNDCGYTGIKDHAARYTEADACARMAPGNGVGRIREDAAPEFSEACFEDLARQHLAQQRDALQARLDMIADIAEGSTTANSLPHIAKIARGAVGE